MGSEASPSCRRRQRFVIQNSQTALDEPRPKAKGKKDQPAAEAPLKRASSLPSPPTAKRRNSVADEEEWAAAFDVDAWQSGSAEDLMFRRPEEHARHSTFLITFCEQKEERPGMTQLPKDKQGVARLIGERFAKVRQSADKRGGGRVPPPARMAVFEEKGAKTGRRHMHTILDFDAPVSVGAALQGALPECDVKVRPNQQGSSSYQSCMAYCMLDKPGQVDPEPLLSAGAHIPNSVWRQLQKQQKREASRKASAEEVWLALAARPAIKDGKHFMLILDKKAEVSPKLGCTC